MLQRARYFDELLNISSTCHEYWSLISYQIALALLTFISLLWGLDSYDLLERMLFFFDLPVSIKMRRDDMLSHVLKIDRIKQAEEVKHAISLLLLLQVEGFGSLVFLLV